MTDNTTRHPRGSRAEQREQTRTLVLQAVLDIIVSDGMRAVRHRGVAERAGVALGTTTYHFSSIEDLIVSAFQFWRARCRLEDNPYYHKMTGLLEPYNGEVIPRRHRRTIAEQVYRFSVDYLCDQLSGKREDRILELAFYHESLGSAPLRELVLSNWQADLDYLAGVHRMLGSPNPVEDARMTLSLFRQLEQSAVIADLPRLDTGVIKRTLRRHMSLCFDIEMAAF